MQETRYKPVLAVLFAVVGLALGGAPAQAQTVQRAHLTATGRFQTWESKTLSPKRPTYALIYYRGRELQQRPLSGCSAIYVGHGIVVRLRVTNCGPGAGTYRLRYASTGRPRDFTVRLVARLGRK